MKTIIILAMALAIFSCDENSDNNPDIVNNDPNKPVDFPLSEIDFYGTWHLSYIKQINNKTTKDYYLKDTLDFKENNLAYWYGESTEEYHGYSTIFYTEDGEWSFDSKEKKIIIWVQYSLEEETGIPFTRIESEIWGYVSKFENGEMTLTFEEQDEEYGYFYYESKYTKIP